MSDVLERFSPATREWFSGAFPAPTPAQVGAWEAISGGSHTLVVAPTGSGKTLAAFLWAIDSLAGRTGVDAPTRTNTAAKESAAKRSTRVLYISPLKALGVDVERNLRAPLVGITQTARRLGHEPPTVSVGVRSGDTLPAERRQLVKNPPDILITTPESLFLMLTSAARETLAAVDTVIIDEVHAVAASKRGAHLALSLERLDAMLATPAQRIGLSATVHPHEEVARFLAGSAPVTIVAPPSTKRFDLRVVVPVEDMSELGTAASASGDEPGGGGGASGGQSPSGSIWPHVEEGIVDLILTHRSSIVFANSRRLAERLTARLNEIYADRTSADAAGSAADPLHADTATMGAIPAQLMGQAGATGGADAQLARAHHGSVSKEQRAMIEDDLKSGRLRCVVATSSLELGIDMGEVDLVVQVESPPSVASGLQRVGRSGHQVGEVSRGVLFPKHRADLIHSTVTAERMEAGLIESLAVPANPLDVLAQQTVAACALEPINADEWFDTVRRSASFGGLGRAVFEATLDLLAGRYPSDRFAELRPRIVWDRDSGTLTGRPGAQRLAVTSGGTIPDRGLFGVFLAGGAATGSAGKTSGTRVGELDEEMVYESRVSDVFALGSTSWRIQEITHDRVLVTPAFGEPGRLPFWKGDGLGRPLELGRAIGAFVREISTASESDARTRLTAVGLDTRAGNNLLAFIAEQRLATGHVPTDRTLVLERGRDELGDWRLVLHSAFGMKVHAPWALAVGARVRERYGIDGSCMASDDGLIVRIPDTESEPPGAELFVFEPAELAQIVTTEVGGSALFASRFRECAARALLLPKYDPGKRAPLWQQRQKASQLLDVARDYPDFPIILETVRECLQDVYDLPGLTDIAGQIENRTIRIVETQTEQASPFARSMLFGYVASFIYEGDSPLAERRAAALSLDAGLLAELLGQAELRELLDPAVIEQTERELQRLAPERQVRGLEGVADLLRMLGPLTSTEVAGRTVADPLADVETPSTTTRLAAGSRQQSSQSPDDGAAEAHSRQVEGWLADLVRSKRALKVTFAGNQWWVAIEDAARLRDALGVPIPFGVPDAFIEPVPDPLGDLLARYARTHTPFTGAEAAARFGLGIAVAQDALRRLAGAGLVVEGEFRPHGAGLEWCDNQVLRRLRNRSLAALRHEVEPVDRQALGRFLPAWQSVGGTLTGVDGVVSVIEQLAGVPLPASAWESLVLPARVADYTPSMLDELTAAGEVIWAGGGSLPGKDGWVSLHLAETAPLTLAVPDSPELAELHRAILDTLTGGGGYFFRQLADAVGSVDDEALVTACWDLAWAGLVTNDTFAPLRVLTGSGTSAHRSPRRAPRARMHSLRPYTRSGRPGQISRTGPPTAQGRWSLLPVAETDPTVRAKATAESLLERYGVVTRGSVVAEQIAGGFALVYRVLSGFEDSGRCRRGYFVEGLGAAQFAAGGTIDRLRSFQRAPDESPWSASSADTVDGHRGLRTASDRGTRSPTTRGGPSAIALAATDPANPYGAALPWPAGAGHRPGRKAGALVVLVDGALVLYVERGGKSVLTFGDGMPTAESATPAAGATSTTAAKVAYEPAAGQTVGPEVRLATDALAAVVRRGGVDRLTVEKVNGEFVLGTPVGTALQASGFTAIPRGLRLHR